MAFEVETKLRLKDFGGTERVVSPQETFHRLREVSHLVGVSRLANITGLDQVGVPTWMAIRPLSRSLTVSQGKGISHDAAKVSAIMEATELFHAENLVPVGKRVSVAEAAKQENFVDLSLLPIRPSADLSPDRTFSWIPGRCLLKDETYWIPRQIIDLNFVDRRESEYLFASSSNGLASGNSAVEAAIHAICEVIERDCSAFSQIKQHLAPYLPNKRVMTSTIKDPICQELLHTIEKSGLTCALWDISDEIGIPCFSCVVHDNDNRTMYASKAAGAGCHPRKRIALLRAITEALQSRLTFVAGARDDIYWNTYTHSIPIDAPNNRAWKEAQQYEAMSVDFESIADFGSGTMDAETIVNELLEALDVHGFGNVILTQLTCVQIGVPVVHVFIPGMEPHLRGEDYCPGPRMMKLLEDLLS